MPTYAYICEKGHPYEEKRLMSEEATRSTCAKPRCNAKLKRIFGTPNITFKGGGFNTRHG